MLQVVIKENILKAFGHPLTPGQLHALAEIETDLASSTRMVRLLQGDVGSGKTLVAFLASAHAIEAGQSYRVVPWQMGIVAKILRLMPNPVYDWLFANAPRKSKTL